MRSSTPERWLRATIDTNLFVSGVIGHGAPRSLLRVWNRDCFLLVLSDSVVGEIGEVIRRPYFRDRYGVTEGHIRRLERRLHRAAKTLSALEPLPAGVVVRDPKDEHVLQTALTGQADYLVTGDDDLLELHGHPSLGHLQIVTVNTFLSLVAQP